jgi:acyl-CoA dehydrogenase
LIDFTLSDRQKTLRERVQAFVRDHVLPAEAGTVEGRPEPAQLEAIREQAKNAGLWNPHLPPEWGGLALSVIDMAIVNAELGPTILGPLALNCAPPDEANMLLLEYAGTTDQKERYLRPLAESRMRSCFAMTERAAGSDPSGIRTRAKADGSHWILSGEKWFTGGAQGAAFAVVVAATNPPAAVNSRLSLFLVDTETAGWHVVREISTMGTRVPGGSCEIRLDQVRVPHDALLGPEGGALGLINERLGRARISHCMRWIGICQHALDLATQRALHRTTFGSHLAQHQAVQAMLADCAMDLYSSRLMLLHTAWLLDTGKPHKQEIAMSKVSISEALNRIVDRALQIHGSLGYSADLPLERYYRNARGARIYDGPSEVLRMSIAFQLLQIAARHNTTRSATGELE